MALTVEVRQLEAEIPSQKCELCMDVGPAAVASAVETATVVREDDFRLEGLTIVMQLRGEG